MVMLNPNLRLIAQMLNNYNNLGLENRAEHRGHIRALAVCAGEWVGLRAGMPMVGCRREW